MDHLLASDDVFGDSPPQRVSGLRRRMPRIVRRVTLCVAVAWLALVAGVGWWMSERAVTMRVEQLAASAHYEVQTTARIVDRLFTEMVSVANMVSHQADVIQLAALYRTDPPGADQLTREQRAAQFVGDPLVRKVGNFMNALSSDLRYARIYMNNLSDDTVTASNWAESDSIVGMIYSGRTYLMNALRYGSGHSFGIARLNRSPSYFVAARIEDSDGAAMGSVTVKFDAPDMALFLTGQHVALIVNSQGRVTTTSSASFMLRNVAALLPPESVRISDDEEPGKPIEIRALADQGQPGQWLVDGKRYLVQRQPLVNTQYQLITLADLDHLVPLRRQHLLTAGFAAVLGLALILLSSQAVGQMVMRRQEERQAAKHTSLLNQDLNAALVDAQARDRQKVEVLGYVGHDLRAPLATISGYSALLIADAPEHQKKLLQTIQRSVKYQLDLIDELLGYAKSELQPLVIQPVAIDLHLLLDDISEYAIALCSQHNNRFRCQCPNPLPRQVVLDGKRLQQVLLNLLSNAAKFTRDGVVTLSVAGKPEGDACALSFKVSDTGIGIDLNQGIDIFGAFQQIQAASGSTGLGLFIAQRIVAAMGGSLRVSSLAGQGSLFSVELLAPIGGESAKGWSAVTPRQTPVANAPTTPAVPRNAMPPDQALDELSHLVRHGCLTDVESWIERHANEADHTPFVALLRERLECFDFAGIQALVSQRTDGA